MMYIFCVLDSLVSVLCVCHVLGNVSGAWFVMVADGSLWSDQWMGNVRTKWELQNLVSGSTGRLQAWSNQHNTVYLKSKWEVLGVFVSYFNLVSPYSAPENTSCRLSTLSVEFFQLLDLIMILPASSFVFAFLKFILKNGCSGVGLGQSFIFTQPKYEAVSSDLRVMSSSFPWVGDFTPLANSQVFFMVPPNLLESL